MSKENLQALAVFKALNNKVIAFQPIFSTITGSLSAGVLLSQLIYWAGTKDYGEFYKTDKELMQETTMGRKEFINAKNLVREYFDIRVYGTPHKTYYQIRIDALLAKLVQSAEKDICKVPKRTFAKCRKGIFYNTEITTEITTDTKQRDPLPEKPEEPKVPDALNLLLEEFKTVNAHYARFFMNKTQRAAITRLKTVYGEESLRAKIRFLETNNKTPFAPIVTTPVELEAKISKIEAFWEQKKQQVTQKSNQDDGHRFTHDGIELVFLKGEWRDAKNPWGIRLNTAYYPEIAQDRLLTREQWEEKQKSYALQT